MLDPALAAQFRRSRADYEQAGLVLAPLTTRMALETVADVLPATSALQVRGEYHEDSLPILRIERVLDQAGGVLYDAAEGPSDPVGAEYSVVAGQAAFRYSLMRPPQRGDFPT